MFNYGENLGIICNAWTSRAIFSRKGIVPTNAFCRKKNMKWGCILETVFEGPPMLLLFPLININKQ